MNCFFNFCIRLSLNHRNYKMEKTNLYTLIKGEFSPLAAQTILMELINQKINFHNVEILSERIKHGAANEHSEKRIDELTTTKNKIQALVAEAIKSNYQLKVDCEIKIELI